MLIVFCQKGLWYSRGMEKRAPKRKHILRNILLAIAAVPVLFVLYIVVATLLSPIFKEVEKARFTKLDEQSRALYEQVKTKSGGSEVWKYEANCEPILGGFKFVTDYNCSTEITAEVVGLSVDQVNALHDKYYGLIDSADFLEPETDLSKQLPGHFGIKFTVSSAERNYTVVGDNAISCNYITKLTQPEAPAGVTHNELYGSDIANGVGRIYLRFTCTDIANDDWYGVDP